MEILLNAFSHVPERQSLDCRLAQSYQKSSLITMLMGKASRVIALVLCRLSSASLLYVTNYSENIVTLELNGDNLDVIATTPGCGDESQYLTPDFANNRLFCLDENPRKGTIVSFDVRDNGTLSKQASIETIAGPVASTLYDDGKGLAVAHL